MPDYANILGREVSFVIDRPLGSRHPRSPNILYELNYGFVPDVLGGDGEEQDIYLLGVEEPVAEGSAVVIAIIHRLNDAEDKWVVAAPGLRYSAEDIQQLTHFQEQFFQTEIYSL